MGADMSLRMHWRALIVNILEAAVAGFKYLRSVVSGWEDLPRSGFPKKRKRAAERHVHAKFGRPLSA